MKVVLVLMLVLLAAATALALGNGAAVTSSVSAAAVQVVDHTSEPAALLLSGSFLLGLAGAVKRFTL